MKALQRLEMIDDEADLFNIRLDHVVCSGGEEEGAHEGATAPEDD
jgi:hypothetical protein